MSVGEMIVHPALAYGLLAAGLTLCVYLFVTLKQDLHRVHCHHLERQEGLEMICQEMGAELATARALLIDVDEKASALPQMSDPKPGMNMSRRGQVLRMHRRGEEPEQIAAALGLPQNEVSLLLKIHEVSQGG